LNIEYNIIMMLKLQTRETTNLSYCTVLMLEACGDSFAEPLLLADMVEPREAGILIDDEVKQLEGTGAVIPANVLLVSPQPLRDASIAEQTMIDTTFGETAAVAALRVDMKCFRTNHQEARHARTPGSPTRTSVGTTKRKLYNPAAYALSPN
jgi:hypothetical protein